MEWRVVRPEKHNAYMNMALDEAVMEFVGSGLSPNTIRFYEWANSSVAIGYFQKIYDEINVNFCEEKKIDFVRRITGGGSMYLDRKGEITYSVISNKNDFPKDINECYKLVSCWLIKALESIGINSKFRPINDITVEEKKISGSAQTRRHGAVMVHGTLLYDLDFRKMFKALKISEEKLSDKLIKKAEESVTSVSNYVEIPKKQVHEVLIQAFTEGKSFDFGRWSSEEMNKAVELVNSKYKTREWNFKR